MPIIKWKPFRDLRRPLQELNDFLGDRGDEWMPMPFVPAFKIEEPAVDISQDKNNLYLEMPLNGLKPENVEIALEDNILTIQGKSEEKEETKEKNYLHREIRRGSFRRSIKLPIEVKGSRAEAEVVNGMLKITIPKIAKIALKATRIPIKIK